MKVTLTAAEFNHISNLLWRDKTSGEYNGNKEQYYKRRDKLITKFERK